MGTSTHLVLWLDSCFKGACLKDTPPNFCAFAAGLANSTKPEEGSSRHATFFADKITSWLGAAAVSRPSGTLSYKSLYDLLLSAQACSDTRTGNKQQPLMFCRDEELEAFK